MAYAVFAIVAVGAHVARTGGAQHGRRRCALGAALRARHQRENVRRAVLAKSLDVGDFGLAE